MPEPSDPLSIRLSTASGLATLLDEARATWLARSDRDADPARAGRDADAAGGERDVNAANDLSAANDLTVASGVDEAVGSDESAEVDATLPTSDDSVAQDKPSVRVRPSTPRWRAFEDAFPTFYQFTNRPRG